MSSPSPSKGCLISRNSQTPSQFWLVDQDQLIPNVANEGYVVPTPHNPLRFLQPFGDTFIEFNLAADVI